MKNNVDDLIQFCLDMSSKNKDNMRQKYLDLVHIIMEYNLLKARQFIGYSYVCDHDLKQDNHPNKEI